MLELKDVGFEVESAEGGTKHILKDINFSVDENEVIVVTGPNGSGKSTLAKVIMGLNKPTSGTINFKNKDITNAPINERADLGVSFAFQQPVRFKGLRVEDLLRIASGRDLSTKEACDYLSQVGLCAVDYIDRELDDSLSGGEMKRIEIAMLLARNKILSIFDEPEAGIDLWSFQNLIEVFQALKEANNGSILIISHQERIFEIADRILILADGQITEEGTRDEMIDKLTAASDVCDYKRG